MTTVREATRADADAIGDLHAETWRAAYGHVLPESAFDASERRRVWHRYFADPGPGWLLVAVQDDELIGFANLGWSREEEGVGELFAIYVRPGSWGTGAGRALIERGEAFLRDAGFEEAMLWMMDGNERADRFYRLAGWTHDGGRKVEEFHGAVITEVRYRKPL